MSDKMRWQYGDTNPVVAAVDSATVIEIGDLLYQMVDDARPASMWKDSNTERLQECFANNFLGVAMQRGCDGDTGPIRVATAGVFEFDCPIGIYELGDLIGASANDTGQLQNQAVQKVVTNRFAIARVAKREGGTAHHSVLVDIRSTVMTGGVYVK